MRALQLTGWQRDPELREVAEPDPQPGEVVVRIGAAGVCHSDLHLLYEFPPGLIPFDPPFTLGHENAGWIEALGAGVTGLEVGDPVAVFGAWGCGHCVRCRQGLENYCMTPEEAGAPRRARPRRRHGAAHARAVGPPRRPARRPRPDRRRPADRRRPDAVPRHPPLAAQAAARLDAVVIGVGGLGHMAVQLLSALTSATIIAVDQRPAALEMAASSGAHVTVVAGDDAAAAIRDATRRPRRRRRARRRRQRRHDAAGRRRRPAARRRHRRRHRRRQRAVRVLRHALRGLPADDVLGQHRRADRGARAGPPRRRSGPRSRRSASTTPPTPTTRCGRDRCTAAPSSSPDGAAADEPFGRRGPQTKLRQARIRDGAARLTERRAGTDG